MAIISQGLPVDAAQWKPNSRLANLRDSVSAKVVAEAFPNTRDTTTVLGEEECR